MLLFAVSTFWFVVEVCNNLLSHVEWEEYRKTKNTPHVCLYISCTYIHTYITVHTYSIISIKLSLQFRYIFVSVALICLIPYLEDSFIESVVSLNSILFLTLYVYIHAYIHPHTHTYIYYIHTHIHPITHPSKHTYIYYITYIHTIHRCSHTSIHTYIHTYPILPSIHYIHTHTYIPTPIDPHNHTYIHTYNPNWTTPDSWLQNWNSPLKSWTRGVLDLFITNKKAIWN